MRWLGLDLGERRIGLALSDPLEITAQAFSVWQRKETLVQDLKYLQKVIQENEVEGLVLGLPKNMNGSEGLMAEKVRFFGRKLEELSGIKVIYWDERLSTSLAERMLLEGDVSRRKRKQKIDQIAAALILQNFLDAKKVFKFD